MAKRRQRHRGWSLAAGLIAVLAPAGTKAADVHEQVAGWTLDDTGGKPGNDADRSVSMHKSLADVALSYSPGENNGSGSIQVRFSRCQGLSYSSGFGFDDPPPDHAGQVRRQIHEAFAEFAQSCRGGGQDEEKLMDGFDPAFQRIEAWMKARPFVFPPDATPDQPGDQPDPNDPDMPTV